MKIESIRCLCGRLFYSTKPDVRECRECRTQPKFNGMVRRNLQMDLMQGSHSYAEWRAQINKQESLCFYCYRRLGAGSDDTRPTKDHKIPISRGGTNFISNIVAACGRCNSRKGNLTAEEYKEQLRKISEVHTVGTTTNLNPLRGGRHSKKSVASALVVSEPQTMAVSGGIAIEMHRKA